jgi:DNA-binding transcriptional regulator YiaG
MKTKKTATIVYEDLGFPVTLINVPMKKVSGRWILDIDLEKLQKAALYALLYKPALWTGGELHFVRTYLGMTTTAFGKIFGVTHAAVLRWEKEERQINPGTEICIRLYVLNLLHVKDNEFRELITKINIEILSTTDRNRLNPIEIDASKDLKIAV